MTGQTDNILLWLYDNAGPIVRWRLVQDFVYPASPKEKEALESEVLATAEVQRWLGNLGSRAIHGSKDTNAENALAKLVEYGLRAGIPSFDQKMEPYLGKGNMATLCFVIAAGYSDQKPVRERFVERLAALHQTAEHGSHDLYLSEKEADKVPKAWQGKLIYRPEFGWDDGLPLPSCYDLYAIAHWCPKSKKQQQQIDDIIAFVCAPEFQTTPGAYLWNRDKNTCYAAGRCCLAVLTPERKVLFMELFARFPEARKQAWFQDALRELESYRTEHGTYIFPSDLMKEKRNSYYIYQGAHMGLGENRRKKIWAEIESTFRMLNIRRLMTK